LKIQRATLRVKGQRAFGLRFCSLFAFYLINLLFTSLLVVDFPLMSTVTLLDANYYLCLLLGLFILLLFGVVTFENVKTLFRGNSTNVIITDTKKTEKTETTNGTP